MYCLYQSFTYYRSVPRFHSFIIAHIVTIKKRIRGYWNTTVNNDKQRKRVKLFVQAHVLIISCSSLWRRSGNPSVFAINGRHLIGRCCDKRGFTVQICLPSSYQGFLHSSFQNFLYDCFQNSSKNYVQHYLQNFLRSFLRVWLQCR